MAHLPGTWTEPTLDGERAVWLDGTVVHVPDDAELKLVFAHHKITILHCRVDDRVYVFSALGQLVEREDESRRRALGNNWSVIAGEKI